MTDAERRVAWRVARRIVDRAVAALAERVYGFERLEDEIDTAWYAATMEAAARDALTAAAWAAHERTWNPRVGAWLDGVIGHPRWRLWQPVLVGVVRVGDLHAGGWWQAVDRFDASGPADGLPAITVGVMEPGGGCCLELVALDPREASNWAIASGLVPVLGYGWIDGVAMWTTPEGRLRLFRHPLDWLRSGPHSAAVCVLDWESADARELLREIDEGRAVVCDDDDHAAELRRRVRPRRPALDIKVAA